MWQDKIKEIIYLLDNSDVNEIDVTFWGRRFRVVKSAVPNYDGESIQAKPVVWTCSGISAGIGTEIGLACHHRIVSDSPRTKIGLPEILIGLFPWRRYDKTD